MTLRIVGRRLCTLASLSASVTLGAADVGAQQATWSPLVEPFQVDSVLSPPSGPQIVRLPAPGSPLVALRLSVPIVEGPAEAGAARIIQMLGERRARALGTSVGAHVESQRTPYGISYTVAGPAADLDYLAYLLRQAIQDPSTQYADFAQARASLMDEAQRRSETPSGRVAAQLRVAAAPTVPPTGGTRGSLTRLTLADIHDVWARTHQPDKMTLLVAGDVDLDLLLVSMMGIGAPTSPLTGPLDAPVSEPTRPRAQVIRHWYGEARAVEGATAPYAELAAILVAEQLRSTGGAFEADVQLWDLQATKVLAVVGAAYRAGRQAMRANIQDVLETTATNLEADDVARAIKDVRTGMLLGARTPLGRVTLVGRHLDATGSALSAQSYLSALDGVTLEGARDFLRALAATSPARAEVGP